MTKGQGVTGDKKGTTGRGKRATGRPATLYMPSWGTDMYPPGKNEHRLGRFHLICKGVWDVMIGQDRQVDEKAMMTKLTDTVEFHILSKTSNKK